MTEIKNRLKDVRDREKWAARRASLAGKVKATKVVWFPPKPVETGKKAASRAKQETTKTAKKTRGAVKKSTAAAKKTTGGTKNVTRSRRQENA